MPRPDDKIVVKWRELAEDGYLYAEIARMYPDFSVDQVRHYCLGHTGRNLPGPIQRVDRWYGSNVWLRGENSPHSELSESLQVARHRLLVRQPQLAVVEARELLPFGDSSIPRATAPHVTPAAKASHEVCRFACPASSTINRQSAKATSAPTGIS